MFVTGLLIVRVAVSCPLNPDPETALPLLVYHFHDKPVPLAGVTDIDAEPLAHIGVGEEGSLMVGAALTVKSAASLVSEHPEALEATHVYEPDIPVVALLIVNVAVATVL